MYKFALLILFSLNAAFCFAQIINTESIKMEADTAGWVGNAHASLSLTKGIDKIFDTEAGLHIQHKQKKHLWIMIGNYSYLKGASQKYADSWLTHLRYSFKVMRRFNLESFIQAESNYIIQLKSKLLAGFGPRIKVFSNKFIHLHVASHITFERKIERTDPVIKHHDLRSSSYVSFIITPNDKVEFSSTFFYQPLYRDFSNYQILNNALLKVKATKHLSLSVRWYLLHDHRPIGKAPESIYTFSTGIDYDL